MATCHIFKHAGTPSYKSPCSECKGFSKYEYEKSKTNSDRIRSMSDEELAKFISYNDTYGTSSKKISKAFKGRKSEKRIAVYAVNKSGDFAGEWDSITEAAKKVGCSTSEISGALKGKRKTVKGLIWNYSRNCGAKMDLEEPNEAKESRQP